MMHLYWTVLAMMTFLAPPVGEETPMTRHGRLATAITTVLEEEAPLYRNDESRVKSAALMVAVAFRESGLRHDAVGDGGKSVCAFQVHMGPKTLLDDTEACTRTAYRMLQESIRVDRSEPVSFYARGPRYQSLEARRLSRDRVAVAERLLLTVPLALR